MDRSDQSVPPLSDEDAELFEALSPELAELLYPEQSSGPFRMALIYPDLGDKNREAVEKLQAEALDHGAEEDGPGDEPSLQQTTFTLDQVEAFHELYHLAEKTVGAGKLKVLLNDRAVPMTRELWLPLIWSLRK